MRLARKVDASGLEKARKVEQAEFDSRVAGVAREKAEARRRRAEAETLRLSKVVLIKQASDIDTLKLTNPQIDDQLAVLRQYDRDIPLKSHLKVKAQKKEALVAALERYQKGLSEGSVAPLVQATPREVIIEGLEEEDEF
ncbi:hypothetical protein HGRIS_003198 [Hohenbuehelia grisea]|uniref:Uncharacterized protein n=1 Tax=Hohenbuehelia grisea TaxID=104357 RepID=A0ABR3JNR7_9AGAR